MKTKAFAFAMLLACNALANPQGPAKNGRAPIQQKYRENEVLLGPQVSIVLSPDAPEPVKRAAADLATDFQNVTGKRPPIVHGLQQSEGTAILIAEQQKLPEGLRPKHLAGAESFSITLHAATSTHQRTSLVLAGADMRGTIFAVYEFSHRYLGIDPLYYWTDHRPAHQTAIWIPASLDRQFPSPVFKYRGFFINDEDLLTGWAPGEVKDKTGISLEVWNKIYEAILRLKGNMVAPGTWIFSDDPQVRLAARRGLIVTQHHAIPLGLNVARWPKDVPYNYSEHPEILERAWKNAVNSYLPDQEVLWSVGLRGLSDVSYASMDPSVRNDNKALGRLISKAISDQISIVRTVRPEANFVTNLWQEGARLVHEGDLKIPPEVTTVWADSGYGYIEDHGEVTAGEGIYDHIAMMNGRANQLTEMVPVARSLSEIARFIKAGATEYFLVNTSDIRPVTMSARAVMDAAWKGVPEGPSPAEEFYREWSQEEFGKGAASKLVELYNQYFKAPARFGDPLHEYGDQLYHTEARRMMLTYMIDWPLYAIPGQAPKWEPPRPLGSRFGAQQQDPKKWLNEMVTREIQQCSDAQPRWDSVWQQALAIKPLIPRERQSFYQAQVLTMIAINRESNRALFLISKAIRDAENGSKSDARNETKLALAALDEIRRAQKASEYGKWRNWYRGDWLTGVYRTREAAEVLLNFLNDPEAHVVPPVLWDDWEAYYHIMHYEEDRTADVK